MGSVSVESPFNPRSILPDDFSDCLSSSKMEMDWDSDDLIDLEVTPPTELPEYERTAIILDWDDTLCPSSWAYSKKLFNADGTVNVANLSALDERSRRYLRKVTRRVVRLLWKARTLGPVFIVTAGDTGWVELTTRTLFGPSVESLLKLEEIMVVSARAWFQAQGTPHPADPMTGLRGSPEDWKYAVFSLIASECFQTGSASLMDPTMGRFHFVSIGDSHVERYACKKVASETPFTVSKTLKLIERPSISEVKAQLELVCNALEFLCRSDSSVDLHLDGLMRR